MKSFMRKMFVGIIVFAFLIGSVSACHLRIRSNEGTATGATDPSNTDSNGKTRETEEIIRQPLLVCDYPSVPAVSVDGSKMILMAREYCRLNFYIMDTECVEKPIRIDYPEGYEINNPSFSPDGEFIVYESAFYVYIIRSDGTGQTQLVRGTKPVFSPDGTRIFYRAKDVSGEQIFSMDLTGSDIRQLTSTTADELDFVLVPDGNKVIYSTMQEKADYVRESGLYVMNADGSDVKLITEFRHTLLFYSLSPDGESIAMCIKDDKQLDIYIINTDEGDMIQVTNDKEQEYLPCFSDDGEKLIFVRALEEGQDDPHLAIFSIHVDGSKPEVLTEAPVDSAWDFEFSVDSGKIFYKNISDSGARIFSMNFDGSDEQVVFETLTDEEKTLSGFTVIPGNKIIYSLDNALYGIISSELFIMNTDGTGQRRITEAEGTICDGPEMFGIYIYEKPQVLTSGNMVYELDGNICVLNVDGTSLQTLTDNGTAADPSFSPDDSKIVFVSEQDGKPSINVMNADGSDRSSLMEVNDGILSRPAFSPDGTKILYVTFPSDMNMSAATINIIDVDGNNPKMLATGYSPEFLRGGGEILYLTDGKLYRMNVDGSAQQLVTEGFEMVYEFEMDYAYDLETNDMLESFILLIAKKDGVCNIYMFDPLDGLTVPYSENESPEVMYYNLTYSDLQGFYSYSTAPGEGGARTLFIQDFNGYYEDTKDYFYLPTPIQLTEAGDDYVPACLSPDGYKIIYVKNGSEIYMMDNDGTLKEKLADGHNPSFAKPEK